MNKKVKYLGAAAAALLTVAPIAAPVFSSVASVSAATTPAKAIALTVSAPADKTVSTSESVASYKTPASFAATSSLGSVVGVSAVDLKVEGSGQFDSENPVFSAGWAYNQTATVSVAGLKAKQAYTVNGAAMTANDEGVITGINISRRINAVDASIEGTPFFELKGIQVYGDLVMPNGVAGAENGAIALTTSNTSSVETAVKALKSNINAYKSSSDTKKVDYSYNVKQDLANQGITVKADGSFTATNFFVTLTATNLDNGKTASVRVPFTFTAQKAIDNSLPFFTTTTQTSDDAAATLEFLRNGQTSKGYVTITKGAAFDPTDTIHATAFASAGNGTQVKFTAVSNNVNTQVPGFYTVQLSATNSNGKTATVNVRVKVLDTAYSLDNINYVPGYGVNEWALAGNSFARFTGLRKLHGTQVRAWDKTTVNGVEYTRVTGDTVSKPEDAKKLNTWVQSRYLASNAAHTNDGETKVSGVATVHYNGKGGVALRDAKGHVTYKQYVKNGSQWKVFAKKTVNGKTLYRLGSQSQWILAQYVTVK